MDGVNCTSCGKQLLDGDWVSKSGLCRACAEGKLVEKESHNPIKHKWWILVVVAVLVVAYSGLNYKESVKSDLQKVVDSAQFVGYIENTSNAVFILFTDDEFHIRDSVKEKITTGLYLKQCDAYPSIDIVTVVLANINTESVYSGFCYMFEDDKVVDIDSDLALAGIALASGAE